MIPNNQSKEGGGAGIAAVVIAACLFSWGFPLVKILGLPVATVASWRLVFGAAVLVVPALVLRTPWSWRSSDAWLAGLCFGAHQLLYTGASLRTSIAIVTLVGALKPLLVGVLSRRAVGEPIPRAFGAFALLGLAGVGLVAFASRGHASRSLLGDLLSVANLVAYAAYFLFAKRARQRGARTLTLTAQVLLIALAVVLPVALVDGGVFAPAGWQWGVLLLLALGPGNGHVLLNWAHQRTSAALASLILGAVPPLAMLWAFLLFDEPLGWAHYLGAALFVVATEGARRSEAREVVVPAPA